MPYHSSRNFRPGGRTSYKSKPGRSGGNQRGKQFIHPDKFVKAASPQAEIDFVPKNKFADFELHPLILQNVINKGFVDPSQIQDETIKLVLEGKDVIGIANTGTGKTAAFALPMLTKMMAQPGKRAIILAPTRELAQQIEAECKSFAKGSGLSGVLLIGGTNMYAQVKALRDQPNIIIGTPGRINDHVRQGKLNLASISTVVLDEVDRMLDMGFLPDIKTILAGLNPVRQSLFFSATMSPTIERLIGEFSVEPVSVNVKTGVTSDNVEQNVVRYQSESDKVSLLHDILLSKELSKALVFEDTQRSVERLGRELTARGFAADAIHGGKNQSQRNRALSKFRDNQVNILVATDVAARGIDVADISHVINFTQPKTYDDYIHRIGRAGRAGKTGIALTFVKS